MSFGLRYDGGDGDTGTGVEVGLGLRRIDPTHGITLEGNIHALVVRDDYAEWGIDGLFRLEAGRDGQGLSLTLTPGYGTTDNASILDEWQPAWVDDNVVNTNTTNSDYHARMKIHLAYGLTVGGIPGRLTPYSEMTLAESTKTHRLGLRWQASTRFGLNLVGEQSEKDDAASEQAILLKGEMRF